MVRLDNVVVSICNKSHNEMLSHYANSHYEKMSQFENSRSANSQYEIVSFCNNVAT